MRLHKLSRGLSESSESTVFNHSLSEFQVYLTENGWLNNPEEYKDYTGPIKIVHDISELSSSDVKALATISPAHLINVHETNGIFVPFVYMGRRPLHMLEQPWMRDKKESNKLFVGNHKEYHDPLIQRVKKQASDQDRYMGDDLGDLHRLVRRGTQLTDEDPTGTVGRYAKLFDVSYWFGVPYSSIFLSEIVALYPCYASTEDDVKNTLSLLVKEYGVSPNAFFVMGKRSSSVRDVLGSSSTDHTQDDESIRLGKLQIALHLGMDEYGRPLDQAARRRIQKELGMTPEEDSDEDPIDREHPWSRGLKNSGKLVPGQKWWAPTSEDIQSGAILENEDEEVDLSWLTGESKPLPKIPVKSLPERSSYNKIVDGMEGGDAGDSYLNEIPPEPIVKRVPLDLNDLTSEDQRMIKHIDPGYLADRPGSKPFISYIDQENNKNHVFVGNEYEYHSELIGAIRHQPHLFSLDVETGKKLADEIEAMWRNISDANLTTQLGTVGRIANEYSFISHRDTGPIRLITPQLITTYSSRSTTPEVVSDTLRELIEKGHVAKDSLYIGNEQYCLVVDAIAGKTAKADEETIRKSKLQIAMHLGQDEYGRPLDQAARKRIQQELNRTPEDEPTDREHPWSRAMKNMNNKDKLVPGQKWWSPTSEEFKSKLDPILEKIENITDYTREELKTINPGRCITNNDSWPFIYYQKELHVGKREGGYHSDLWEYDGWGPTNDEDVNYDVDPLQMFYEIVVHDDYPGFDTIPVGTVGRICKNYETVFGIIPSLVTIYSTKSATPEAVQETLQELLKKKLITPKSTFIGNGQVAQVSEVLSIGSNEADEESLRLGKLQIMLHRGTDEYGNRLDGPTRKRIAKELGMEPGESEEPIDREHPWSRAMKNMDNKDKLVPGQKWWTPTSEDIIRYKQKLISSLEEKHPE